MAGVFNLRRSFSAALSPYGESLPTMRRFNLVDGTAYGLLAHPAATVLAAFRAALAGASRRLCL